MEIKIYNMELDAKKHPALIMESQVRFGYGKFTSPDQVADLCISTLRMDRMAEEQMWMLAVNAAGYPLGLFRISHGTVCSTICQPREVYIRALATGATGILLIHNHPSGNCCPSREDKLCCERIAEAGKLIGITLNDFVIVGDGYYSFLEQGEIK